MKMRWAWSALALVAATATAQPADDSLYVAFGGQNGLVSLMDDFHARLLADERMYPFFKDVKGDHLKRELVTQFCQLAGGPCQRRGPDMKRAHDGVDITKADFNALIEVLQKSMDVHGIPFGVQNRLLARLAPMHRDIINAP